MVMKFMKNYMSQMKKLSLVNLKISQLMKTCMIWIIEIDRVLRLEGKDQELTVMIKYKEIVDIN